jgi:hypothetical protein
MIQPDLLGYGRALQREMRALTVPASTSTVASAETTAAPWEEKPAKSVSKAAPSFPLRPSIEPATAALASPASRDREGGGFHAR